MLANSVKLVLPQVPQKMMVEGPLGGNFHREKHGIDHAMRTQGPKTLELYMGMSQTEVSFFGSKMEEKGHFILRHPHIPSVHNYLFEVLSYFKISDLPIILRSYPTHALQSYRFLLNASSHKQHPPVCLGENMYALISGIHAFAIFHLFGKPKGKLHRCHAKT